ncbi:MAG: transcriptional regulator [Chloroflexi bacterium]|nr:transcriptional regulator [Chloroflexota bacterium]
MSEDANFRTFYNEGVYKFQAIQNRVFWQELLSHLTGRHSELMNFDEVRSRLHLHEEHYEGVRDIPLENIVGSVGRYKDFTATFLPKNSKLKERWSRVYALANSQEGPPPIELYKVGDAYFVRDGNHRVSVARQLGAKTIQAHVVALPTTVPLRPGMSEQQMEAAEAYANFLDETGLTRAVTDHESIELTVPARYHELMGHIFLHERVLEKLWGRALTTEEVTADWYHSIYKPAIDLIRKYDVLDLVRGRKTQRTEGDLFLWLMNVLLELRHQYGEEAPVKSFSEAIVSYLESGHAAVPDALEHEGDGSVLLTRTQVMTELRKRRAQELGAEDSSETDSAIT